MSKSLNLYYKRFHRLIVIKRVVNSRCGHSRWLCKCDCGKIVIVIGKHLVSSHTRSCGCLQKEKVTRHGHTIFRKSPTYLSWDHMIQRCVNSRLRQYGDYGGRGIKVCERWMKFENFLEDMGESPGHGYSIDRTDNDKGYYKSNCKWSTRKEQARNRRNNRMITFNDKTKCISEWSEETGINANTIRSRLKAGWSIEKTLTTPVRKRR